jgi:predicted lipid-binding transport protein (Tim44 family)
LSRALGRAFGVAAVSGVLFAGALTPLDADARRMGSGRSFGQQSQMTRPAPAPTQPGQAAPAAPVTPAQQQARPGTPPAQPVQPARNRWLGPLAGLAAGFGIAALLSHFGLGGMLAGLIGNLLVLALIALAVVFVVRLITRRRQGGGANAPYARGVHQPAYGAPGGSGFGTPGGGEPQRDAMREPQYSTPPSGGALEPMARPLNTSSIDPVATTGAASIPAGFDVDSFLRNAKQSFVQLQSAWDAGRLDEIRDLTTPDMFREIQADLATRGASPNRTDVVKLDADLVGVADHGDEYEAAMRFHGLIREMEGAAAEPFDETWTLTKSAKGGEGWVLAGIQQAR